MSIKKFPKLYKLTTSGKTQEWQIIAQKDEFYTIEGLLGGKLTTSKPTKCISKNVGKKNETSPEEQALAQAQAKWEKKNREGYSTDSKNATRAQYFEPMLADKYRIRDTGEKAKWIDKYVWKSPVRKFVQPKLDGIRCISKNDATLNSREGKLFVSCPHLHQYEYLLDGELYNHDLKDDFNAIAKLIKREKLTAEQFKETASKVQYWVYDFPGAKGTFSERYEKLEEIAGDFPLTFYLVPTYEISSEEELFKYHKKFLKEGYEGTILRMDTPYENKRTKNLIKLKDTIDEEFEIVGYEEGEGGRTGTIGKFILKHDKDPKKTFESNVKGTHAYLKEIWDNREYYIGKSATVQYDNRTPLQENGKGDVPRFGYVIKIDRESYE